MSVSLGLEAPAKVNLSLAVVGRREDGFHLLETEMALLELADRLLLLPGCSGLRVEGEGRAQLPLDEANLALRGLRAGLGGEPELACLALDKRIPVAAGLGGGSSDAAAAWRLGRAWSGAPEAADAGTLEALSAIGADVPFFAAQVAAGRVGGIGERVQPLPPHEAEVVLVHAPYELATAAVFAELRPEEWGSGDNDLLAPALRLRPELDDVMAAVRRAGGNPRLSGSGPTMYDLDDDPERGDAIAERLAARGLRVTRTRTRTEPAIIDRVDPEEE